MAEFTCGIRITCAMGPCMFTACANPKHVEYRGENPHRVMSRHRAEAHGVGQEGERP